jgi:hypothetical protein
MAVRFSSWLASPGLTELVTASLFCVVDAIVGRLDLRIYDAPRVDCESRDRGVWELGAGSRELGLSGGSRDPGIRVEEPGAASSGVELGDSRYTVTLIREGRIGRRRRKEVNLGNCCSSIERIW